MQNSFKLGLIGYPLQHSLSPKIHMAALKSCEFSGDYSLFSVAPDDLQEVSRLLEHLHSRIIHGLNITIPHKQRIIPFLDDLTSIAQAIGAVNTVYLHSGKLIGDNTDSAGFMADLNKLSALNPQNFRGDGSALVLGAGGSARAVVYSLINNGWNVRVATRRRIQVQTLIEQYLEYRTSLSSIEFDASALKSILPSISLLVNTTPVGMFPGVDASPWPAGLPLPPNAMVYDLVYNPLETKLVTDARSFGLSAYNGLGMLIEQAALSFEIWTGCKPTYKDLADAIS
jgi:shikimate dehydrogenase